MDTEKLKPFNEFNSEKSAMVNEICYMLFKEIKKILIPTQIEANAQIAVTIGTAAEYGNTGCVPILFETGANGLAFGKYIDNTRASLVIKNTSTTAVRTGGVLYLLVMEVK